MSFLEVIILGLLQGITEFLPVSSFGHLLAAEALMGIERNTGELLEAMLHLGTAFTILFVYWKDFARMGAEVGGMLTDILHNAVIWVHNRRQTDEDLPYAEVMSTTWRKLAMLVLVSLIPTAAVGCSARRLVTMVAASPFFPGALMLISGIFLLVTDLAQGGSRTSIKEAGYDSAMWMGICQGLAVFPGISRSALTICAGLLCGQGRKFVIKFSYIISVPAIIGACIVEFRHFDSVSMTSSLAWSYFFAMVIACLFGIAFMRVLLKLTRSLKLRIFAYYNFLIGIIFLVRNFG